MRVSPAPRRRRPVEALTFAAIDFEIANPDRSSVCALAVVRVVGGRVKERFATRVRPPTRDFRFSGIHGIGPSDVRGAPRFADAWAEVEPLLRGVRFLAAHNAGFDRSVLRRSCERFGVRMPAAPFRCTVKLARERWGLYPTKLPNVAAYLGLGLEHHDPASDAEVCAQIVLRAGQDGVSE